MKKLILTLAAALTLGGAVAAVPADAQTHRTVVRTTHTVVVHRRTQMNNDNRGVRSHRRTCRTVWRHHRRIRTCRTW
jgi:hypothetical protein